MKKLWLVFGACGLAGAFYGCASDEQARGSAADSAPRSQPVYITGSRLPARDTAGTSSVGQSSRDEYIDDRNRGVAPLGGK